MRIAPPCCTCVVYSWIHREQVYAACQQHLLKKIRAPFYHSIYERDRFPYLYFLRKKQQHIFLLFVFGFHFIPYPYTVIPTNIDARAFNWERAICHLLQLTEKHIRVLLLSFFQSFSRSFYSSLILLSLLTFFITHCISCVGGSLIFHGMETSSPERQRSSPIDKCQDSLHSFTLPVQTFTARIRLATSTESNHSHSIHVKHERFTQTTFFPATSTL